MPSFTVIFRACGKNGIARWWDLGRTCVRFQAGTYRGSRRIYEPLHVSFLTSFIWWNRLSCPCSLHELNPRSLSLSAFFTLAGLPTVTSNLLTSSHAWYLVFADLRPSSERFPVGAVPSGATVPAVPASSSLRYTFSSDLLSFPI
ncbi:hypothetical protein L208DRAFT_1397934 [Tricholoma matsutake]|nr:hypothetical protein L208DRAFT_1397934 [Tricholoma matsutake 945]